MSERKNKPEQFAKKNCVVCNKKDECDLPCSSAINMLFFECEMTDFQEMGVLMKNARQRVGI